MSKNKQYADYDIEAGRVNTSKAQRSADDANSLARENEGCILEVADVASENDGCIFPHLPDLQIHNKHRIDIYGQKSAYPCSQNGYIFCNSEDHSLPDLSQLLFCPPL